MTAVDFSLGSGYKFVEGRVVSEKHHRVAEILHDYNSELELAWIPPESRVDIDDKPFAVIHNQNDGHQYVVMYLREDEVDERVLARIFAADMRRHNPDNVMAEIEANEAAQQIFRAKEVEDKKAEQLDLAKSILKSKLHTYRHGGKKYGS